MKKTKACNITCFATLLLSLPMPRCIVMRCEVNSNYQMSKAAMLERTQDRASNKIFATQPDMCVLLLCLWYDAERDHAEDPTSNTHRVGLDPRPPRKRCACQVSPLHLEMGPVVNASRLQKNGWTWTSQAINVTRLVKVIALTVRATTSYPDIFLPMSTNSLLTECHNM